MISKELLREVLTIDYAFDIQPVKEWQPNILEWYRPEIYKEQTHSINIYELAHKNLKQWAKLKNVFDIFNWSEEPEKIFAKAEELRNEFDKRLRDN